MFWELLQRIGGFFVTADDHLCTSEFITAAQWKLKFFFVSVVVAVQLTAEENQ